MKTKKTLLVVIFLIVSSMLLVSVVYAGFSIRLEKDIPMSELSAVPTTITFKIYDSDVAPTPIASQTFSSGEWTADYNFYKFTTFAQDMVRFKADFSNTDCLTKDMELWLEIELDGVVKGERESIKNEARAMFSDDTKFPTPDFDSDWFFMSSQAGINSYVEILHDLGAYPSRVKVLLRAIDGNNKGFIFEGSGSAQNDDDTSNKNYGGVVFAYDQTRVRLWAPDENNNYGHGGIINISDGWGGEVNSQTSHTAEVKVLVWK